MQLSISWNPRWIAKPASYALLAVAMLGLAACGGSSGNDSPPPPSEPSNPPPPPPGNTAPTVEAGADQAITLPANSVNVEGTASDADNNTLTYAWTSAPADGVTFTNAAALATSVTFTDAGTYTLTLSVNDGTATSTDSLTVTVNPAVVGPPPGDPEIAWPGPHDGVDPNYGWLAVAPADVGMDSARLQEASDYALTGGGAGMVVRYGKLVHRWSDGATDINIRVDLKSTTKSIGSIAMGIALDRGLIALNDTAQSRYPNIGISPGDPTPPDAAWLSQITLQQLATHTSGFVKGGGPDVDLAHQPGTKWVYSDGGLNWLADTLTNVFQEDLNALLTREVWQPLDITNSDLQWRVPSAGVGARPPIGTIQTREFASGIIANSNAMARIGLLFLREGMWKEQRILSESFVQTASTPRPETAAAELVDPTGFPGANTAYGLMWWTNANGQLPDVPRDAYWAWGLGDSLIVVIPSLDLVIARVGDHPDSGVLRWRPSWDGNYEVLRPFLTPIAQAVSTP